VVESFAEGIWDWEHRRGRIKMRHTAARFGWPLGEHRNGLPASSGHTNTGCCFAFGRYVPNLTRPGWIGHGALYGWPTLHRTPSSETKKTGATDATTAGHDLAQGHEPHLCACEMSRAATPIPKPRGIHGARRWFPAPTLEPIRRHR
jgi:hypothetical protein